MFKGIKTAAAHAAMGLLYKKPAAVKAAFVRGAKCAHGKGIKTVLATYAKHGLPKTPAGFGFCAGAVFAALTGVYVAPYAAGGVGFTLHGTFLGRV